MVTPWHHLVSLSIFIVFILLSLVNILDTELQACRCVMLESAVKPHLHFDPCDPHAVMVVITGVRGATNPAHPQL